MIPSAARLKMGLLLLFCEIYLLALILLIVGNLTVNQNSVAMLAGFWALQMLALAVIFILPGYWVSCFLLKPLFSWLGSGDAAPWDLPRLARQAVFRYPWQILFFYLAFGIYGSGVFHLTQSWHEFGSLRATPEWLALTLREYLYELSLSIALGMIHFVAARRMLRPYLLSLPAPVSRDTRRFSIRTRFLVTVGALALTSTLPLVTAYLNSFYFHQLISGWGLLIITLQALILNAIVGFFFAGDTAFDLTHITQELNSLAAGDRQSLRRALPLPSDDEIGDLVLAFNALQARAQTFERDMEQQLELARRVQAELLPHNNTAKGGWVVTALSQPAWEVGGDFYDVLDLGAGRLGIAVGDAAGTGLPAALLMAAAIGFLRAEAYRELKPGQILTRINKLLSGTVPVGYFVTLFYMVLDTKSGNCVWSSAGHIDPLLIEPGRPKAGFLTVSSLPLGIDPEACYREQVMKLVPGSKFLLYTDGIVEARDKGKKLFGFSGLARAAEKGIPEQTGTGLAGSILAEVQNFTGGEVEDDLTILLIEAPEGGTETWKILHEQLS